MTVHHRPTCPLRAALNEEARSDAARLLVAGTNRYIRPLTPTERVEFRWLRPDLDPDDYRVLVGLLDHDLRVRGYVHRDREDV